MRTRLENIKRRQAAIQSLIAARNISSHEKLAQALCSLNIKVTQATLSRDLTVLGIVRVPHETGHRYELPLAGAGGVSVSRIAEEVISVEANGCLIVIRTFPGRASGVALQLDLHRDSEFLGTIAGDDTVFVAPRSLKRIKHAVELVVEYVGLK